MRGVPLPPLGSFQERILSEMLIRERNEKFAHTALLATLLGKISGLDPKIIGGLLEEYREELYRLRYNSKYVTVAQKELSSRVACAERERRLMDHLEKITKIPGENISGD